MTAPRRPWRAGGADARVGSQARVGGFESWSRRARTNVASDRRRALAGLRLRAVVVYGRRDSAFVVLERRRTVPQSPARLRADLKYCWIGSQPLGY